MLLRSANHLKRIIILPYLESFALFPVIYKTNIETVKTNIEIMKLSRVEKDISVVLKSNKRSLYCIEITNILNEQMPDSWQPFKNQSIQTTLTRMIGKGLICQIAMKNFTNKKHYKLTKIGLHSLEEDEAYYQRLSA